MRLIRFGIISQPQGDNLYEDKRWRCCLCCHVRTGTIVLGVWHLALHMLTLAAIAVLVLHPQAINPNSIQRGRNGVSMIESDIDLDMLAALPTPLSAGINEEPQALPFSDIVTNQVPVPKPTSDSPSKLLYGSFVYKDWFGEHQAPEHSITYRNFTTHSLPEQFLLTSDYVEELNINIGINFCTLGITFLMIYGAIKGKSLYLMPFFCLQAFDFFVTSLSVIGYLSIVPDIRQTLLRTPNIPLRNELLALDPQFLSLLVLAGILLNLIVKLYFINVVWSCYKYLTIRAEAAIERENCITGIVDGQNLLEIPLCPMASPGADLPDYATAVSDPRFAKKPMYPVPPPPYTAVANLTVENEQEQPENEAPRQEEERANPSTGSQENPKA